MWSASLDRTCDGGTEGALLVSIAAKSEAACVRWTQHGLGSEVKYITITLHTYVEKSGHDQNMG